MTDSLDGLLELTLRLYSVEAVVKAAVSNMIISRQICNILAGRSRARSFPAGHPRALSTFPALRTNLIFTNYSAPLESDKKFIFDLCRSVICAQTTHNSQVTGKK